MNNQENNGFETSIKQINFADKIGLPLILHNLPRTLLAFVSTVLLSMFMTAMQAVADNRAIAVGLHRQADQPLPDLLMDLAPASVPMHMADLFLNSLIGFSIFMISKAMKGIWFHPLCL